MAAPLSETAASAQPDTPAATDFLLRWSKGAPIVVTSIIPDGNTTTATFDPPQVEEMRAWIDERQGIENLYFHVNPVRRRLNIKASKEDIDRLACLHVDIDPRAGENIAEERARALKLLNEFVPKPTVIVDSGGGYQGFWALRIIPALAITCALMRQVPARVPCLPTVDNCHTLTVDQTPLTMIRGLKALAHAR